MDWKDKNSQGFKLYFKDLSNETDYKVSDFTKNRFFEFLVQDRNDPKSIRAIGDNLLG
jgi:hypothetical protein